MAKTFTTYITTWDIDPLLQIQNMINKSAILTNIRFVLAYANFNFLNSDNIPGFNDITIDKVKQITELVHLNNNKISLSIGGATNPFTGSTLYTQPGILANNINQILIKCNFDGVDFDIEDENANIPADFTNQLSNVINTLKNLNNNIYISLTTPGQLLAVACYQHQLLNLIIGNINAWIPMEYDLWIQENLNYYTQVQYDINYYITNWLIPSNKIILGLMPGQDDINNNLSLQDALNLTSYSIDNNLQGIMTWNINIDSIGVDGNAPFAYTMGIQSILKKNTSVLPNYRKNKFKNLIKNSTNFV